MKLAAVALIMLAPSAALAGRCDIMLFKDDLPDCVKELNSRIFILQAQLDAAESQNRLYRIITCNLALKLNKSVPDADTLGIVEAACAEAKAAAKSKGKPAK